MKLYYYSKKPNFGDALNPWLWKKLLPEVFFDNNDSEIFVGIGTLLRGDLPTEPVKHLFGSGTGYSSPPANWLERSKVYCVRGPLTAHTLGLAPRLAISDPAILVNRCGIEVTSTQFEFSYMPHHRSMDYWEWDRICNDAGLHFISPMNPVNDILEDISRTKVLLTEAMHGAIVADALRVPWIPVKAYPHVLSFKWRDWALSVGLEYKPQALPPLYSTTALANKIRSQMTHSGVHARILEGAIQTILRHAAIRLNKPLAAHVTKKLIAAKGTKPFLSDIKVFRNRLVRLEDRMAELIAHVEATRMVL